MHATCPHCHHDLPGTNVLPSRFQIGAPVWIYHGAARRLGIVVGVTFRVMSVDYLVHTNTGVENVPSLDVTPHQPPHAVEGNVVTLASRGAACT